MSSRCTLAHLSSVLHHPCTAQLLAPYIAASKELPVNKHNLYSSQCSAPHFQAGHELNLDAINRTFKVLQNLSGFGVVHPCRMTHHIAKEDFLDDYCCYFTICLICMPVL